MGTQLFIYKVKNLDYAKNMIIEDLESFLTNEATLMYQDLKFQFLPLASVKTIKIDLSSTTFSSAEAKQKASALATLGTYIKTINKANADAETFVAYYYITSASYVAEKTIMFTLTLDVLNSFYNDFKNKFTNRTRAMRQHKDRFWNRSFGSGYYVRRFYDTNEGFNPAKFLTNKLYWNDPDSYGLTGETQKFYLIDKTPSQAEQEAVNKVVNSYLTFDNKPQSRKFVISASYDTFEDVLQNVATSSVVVIDAVNNPSMSYLDPSNNERQNLEYKINKLFCIILYHDEYSAWKLWGCIYQPTPSFDYRRVVIYDKTLTTPSDWKLDNCQFIHIEENSTPSQFMNNHRTVASVVSTTQVSGTAKKIVSDYSVVDTSDFTINNIFVLPYSPINLDIQYLSGNYVITNDKDISVDTSNSYLLRLKDGTEFSRSWTFNGTSIASEYLDIIYENNLIVKIADVSYIELESRLYGSEFFQWGIWFAGQQVLINNEKFKFTTAVSQLPIFKLNYKVSNSFSGHFLFKIEWLDAWDKYGGLNDPEDLVLFVSKDNRNVLYQNNYLDYRKTMQQFDKQALAIAQSQSWFNAGSSIANSLLMSAISAGDTKNPVSIAKRDIGLFSSISSSLGNAIFAQINNENSLRQKEASLAAQRTSIRAGADVDLQNAINGNKLYFVRYAVGDQLKTNLYNYFRLYGYACNDYGIPNLQSRKLYNYIECEADFDLDGTEIYLMYLTNIKEKFKNGCTIFHKYNNTWNLLQNNENWEVWYNE